MADGLGEIKYRQFSFSICFITFGFLKPQIYNIYFITLGLFLSFIRLIDYCLWIVFRCFYRKEITTCHHMKGESLHSVCVRVAPLRRRCKSNLFIFVCHCTINRFLMWHVEFILYTVVYMKITTARSYHYDIIHTQRVAREVTFFYTSFHLFSFHFICPFGFYCIFC